MISEIRLHNIQKHSDLNLVLSPNVNCIYGETDTGKTSILRGLAWCLFNDGDITSLTKYGEKNAFVTCVIDGHELTRSYGSKNTYSLDGKIYTSFRSSVPTQIEQFLKLDTLSVQMRRDPPFMVYYRQSEVADQFAEMLDLNQIQVSINNIKQQVKQKQDALDNLIKRKEQVDDSLKKLDGIEQAGRAVSHIRLLFERTKTLANRKTELASLLQKAQSISTRLRSLANAPTAVKAFNRIVGMQKQLDALTSRAKGLKSHLSNWERIETKMKVLKDAHKALESINRINELYENVIRTENTKQKVAKTQNNYVTINRAYLQAQETLSGLQADWDSHAGERCPVCGNTL